MPKTPEKEMKTSSLLFDEAPLLVRPELAVRVGLNEAIVLQQIHYWLENKRKSTKEKDLEHERTYQQGRFWTYDSYKDWQRQFPFWSVRTVERVFTSLEEKGILISGNFNQWKTDRTKWYTIDYDALDTYEKGKKKKKDNKKELEDADSAHDDKVADCNKPQSDNLAECDLEQSANLAEPLRQSGVTNLPSCGDQSAKLGSPIPKTSTEISPKTSDQDFSNSSSLYEEDNSYIEEQPITKEDEEEFKRNLMYLGCELASSGIMRTNRQIDETIKLMSDRGILDFDDVDVERAIIHYKKECANRGSIGQPPLFFTNGFEQKLNERHSATIGKEERERRQASREKMANRSERPVPFYNWLEE